MAEQDKFGNSAAVAEPPMTQPIDTTTPPLNPVAEQQVNEILSQNPLETPQVPEQPVSRYDEVRTKIGEYKVDTKTGKMRAPRTIRDYQANQYKALVNDPNVSRDDLMQWSAGDKVLRRHVFGKVASEVDSKTQEAVKQAATSAIEAGAFAEHQDPTLSMAKAELGGIGAKLNEFAKLQEHAVGKGINSSWFDRSVREQRRKLYKDFVGRLTTDGKTDVLNQLASNDQYLARLLSEKQRTPKAKVQTQPAVQAESSASQAPVTSDPVVNMMDSSGIRREQPTSHIQENTQTTSTQTPEDLGITPFPEEPQFTPVSEMSVGTTASTTEDPNGITPFDAATVTTQQEAMTTPIAQPELPSNQTDAYFNQIGNMAQSQAATAAEAATKINEIRTEQATPTVTPPIENLPSSQTQEYFNSFSQHAQEQANAAANALKKFEDVRTAQQASNESQSTRPGTVQQLTNEEAAHPTKELNNPITVAVDDSRNYFDQIGKMAEEKAAAAAQSQQTINDVRAAQNVPSAEDTAFRKQAESGYTPMELEQGKDRIDQIKKLAAAFQTNLDAKTKPDETGLKRRFSGFRSRNGIIALAGVSGLIGGTIVGTHTSTEQTKDVPPTSGDQGISQDQGSNTTFTSGALEQMADGTVNVHVDKLPEFNTQSQTADKVTTENATNSTAPTTETTTTTVAAAPDTQESASVAPTTLPPTFAAAPDTMPSTLPVASMNSNTAEPTVSTRPVSTPETLVGDGTGGPETTAENAPTTPDIANEVTSHEFEQGETFGAVLAGSTDQEAIAAYLNNPENIDVIEANVILNLGKEGFDYSVEDVKATFDAVRAGSRPMSDAWHYLDNVAAAGEDPTGDRDVYNVASEFVVDQFKTDRDAFYADHGLATEQVATVESVQPVQQDSVERAAPVAQTGETLQTTPDTAQSTSGGFFSKLFRRGR